MPETPPPPGKPHGRALRWTQEEIDALANVRPEDIGSAEAFWEENAPKPFKKLLGAEETDENAPS